MSHKIRGNDEFAIVKPANRKLLRRLNSAKPLYLMMSAPVGFLAAVAAAAMYFS